MDFKKAELICTGSELVSSKSNRYVPLFASRLRRLGFRIYREHSVGDDLKAIARLVTCGLNNADLVITCGGLGPTFDDLTRQGVAKALGRKLRYSKYAEQILKSDYRLHKLPPNFKDQCLIIDGAKMVENANGTAFGQVLTLGKKMIAVLPGPQSEWTPMFDAFMADEIKEFFKIKEGTIKTLRLKIAGLSEVAAEQLLAPVMRGFPNADYTVLAGADIVEFDFTVAGRTPDESGGRLARIENACRKILGGRIYGTGEATLEGTVGALLEKNKATLSTAESCTGGAIGDALTNVPGSSAYFMGGVVCYSNKAKETVLGVRRSILTKHGAVSAECAAEMAGRARRLFKTDYAVSVTGIAGPEGGTKEKPVGLVYFAVAGPGLKTRTFTRTFRRTRVQIKRCAVNFALDALRKIIQ
ncbi:MAG: nicotinamide-nucleotide amidohydrolase family protein [Elusimicrobiales bacterium]|jgi:nicotinamide-nucleotide amidase